MDAGIHLRLTDTGIGLSLRSCIQIPLLCFGGAKAEPEYTSLFRTDEIYRLNEDSCLLYNAAIKTCTGYNFQG